MTTAHTRRRGPGSNAASELRAVRQAIQGMTTKLLLFPKLRTVWFSCVVVLRLAVWFQFWLAKTQSRWVAGVLAGWRGFKISLDTLGYDACASKRSHARPPPVPKNSVDVENEMIQLRTNPPHSKDTPSYSHTQNYIKWVATAELKFTEL